MSLTRGKQVPGLAFGIKLRVVLENPSGPIARALSSTIARTDGTYLQSQKLMARIYPFRATRYNPTAVRIEDVVTQPYDKITPAMQQVYYGRSPYNLVRIILGLPELFDEPGIDDVYTRAARDFREWRANGILQTDNDS